MTKTCRYLLIAFGLFAGTSHALAAHCTVTSASSLNFGNYDPFSAEPLDSAATVQVTCNGNATVRLSISGQSGAGPRQMTGAGDMLNYQLYTDATRQTIWGDDTGGTQTVSLSLRGNPRIGLFTIYGRVLSGQDASVGTYSATLIMTVDF